MKKILIIAPYPFGQAPSQRFRFEHFLKFIEEKGIAYDFQSFLSTKAWNTLYQDGNRTSKFIGVFNGFRRRLNLFFVLNSYDSVFIHREASPLGPPIFEFLITRVFKKRLIYDFDDAIWLPDQYEATIWTWLKWRSKIESICKWSWKVSAGNQYLADFAMKYCEHVEIMPTVINSQIHTPRIKKSGTEASNSLASTNKLVIGWTGSHSTLSYLDMIVPILKLLERDTEFLFLVIANKDPELTLKNYKFIKWNLETEIEDLSQIDIGVMPLKNDSWSKGKCGFKLIQYLALEIPAVASPVGVNTDLIKHDETGFLASTPDHWLMFLKKLIENKQLRQRIGSNGRKLVETNYSTDSLRRSFVNLFEN